MKTYPPRCRRTPRHLRVPPFLPVPVRARADGWTPMRQAAFLGALAETGSVCEAARRVGMARETAYRLRVRPDGQSFAAAWDAALGKESASPRKVTRQERAGRAVTGLLKLHFYRGKHVATTEKTDNSALCGHLAQIDRALARYDAGGRRSQGFDGG